MLGICQHLLHPCHVPGTVLATRNRNMNKTVQVWGQYLLMGQALKEHIMFENHRCLHTAECGRHKHTHTPSGRMEVMEVLRSSGRHSKGKSGPEPGWTG